MEVLWYVKSGLRVCMSILWSELCVCVRVNWVVCVCFGCGFCVCPIGMECLLLRFGQDSTTGLVRFQFWLLLLTLQGPFVLFSIIY